MLKSSSSATSNDRSFFILFSGNLFAKFASLLFYPIISRIFQSDEFGEYSIYITLTTLLSIYSTGRYSNSLYILQGQKQRIMLNISFLIAFFVSTCLLVYALFFYKSIILLISEKETRALIFCVFCMPLLIFLSGITEIARVFWIQRNLYLFMSFYITASTITPPFLQLLFYFFGFDSPLILGLVIANIFFGIWAMATIKGLLSKKMNLNIKTIKLGLSYIRKHIDYPVFNGGSVFAIYLSLMLSLALFDQLYGAYSVGIFAMSNRLIKIPIDVLVNSLSEHISGLVSDMRNLNDSHKFFYKTLIGTTLLTVLYSAAILISFPIIIPLLLGDAWIEVATISKYIVFPIAFNGIVMGLCLQFFTLINKQKYVSCTVAISELLLPLVIFFSEDNFYNTLETYLILFIFWSASASLCLFAYSNKVLKSA